MGDDPNARRESENAPIPSSAERRNPTCKASTAWAIPNNNNTSINSNNNNDSNNNNNNNNNNSVKRATVEFPIKIQEKRMIFHVYVRDHLTSCCKIMLFLNRMIH